MKISALATFKCPITVAIPGGAEADTQFIAHFRALGLDELVASPPLETREAQDAHLRRVLIGWEGITDDRDGGAEPVEFVYSEENLAQLINTVPVRLALLAAYMPGLTGATRGN